MGVKKASKSKTSKAGKVAKTAKALFAKTGSSSKGGGGKRRGHGPTYWANKVLVEKLKKRYNRLKYGGMR